MENEMTLNQQVRDMDKELNEFKQVWRDMGARYAWTDKKITIMKNPSDSLNVYTFELCNPWYTGTYVSTLSSITLKVNHKEIEQKSIYFVLREQMLPVHILKTVHELWWACGEVVKIFVEEAAVADIMKNDNEIELAMVMRSVGSYGIPGDFVDYTFQANMEVI